MDTVGRAADLLLRQAPAEGHRLLPLTAGPGAVLGGEEGIEGGREVGKKGQGRKEGKTGERKEGQGRKGGKVKGEKRLKVGRKQGREEGGGMEGIQQRREVGKRGHGRK